MKVTKYQHKAEALPKNQSNLRQTTAQKKHHRVNTLFIHQEDEYQNNSMQKQLPVKVDKNLVSPQNIELINDSEYFRQLSLSFYPKENEPEEHLIPQRNFHSHDKAPSDPVLPKKRIIRTNLEKDHSEASKKHLSKIPVSPRNRALELTHSTSVQDQLPAKKSIISPKQSTLRETQQSPKAFQIRKNKINLANGNGGVLRIQIDKDDLHNQSLSPRDSSQTRAVKVNLKNPQKRPIKEISYKRVSSPNTNLNGLKSPSLSQQRSPKLLQIKIPKEKQTIGNSSLLASDSKASLAKENPIPSAKHEIPTTTEKAELIIPKIVRKNKQIGVDNHLRLLLSKEQAKIGEQIAFQIKHLESGDQIYYSKTEQTPKGNKIINFDKGIA